MQKRKILAILTAAGLVIAAPIAYEAWRVRRERDFGEYGYDAITSLNHHDNEAAIANCDKALNIHPDNLQVHITRGTAYLFMEDWDRALRDFDEAVRIAPEDFHGYTMRAAVLTRKKEWDKALADYNKAIQLNPSANLYRARAEIFYQKQDFQKTIDESTKCIELNPQDAIAFYDRAESWLQLGDYDHALGDVDESLRLEKGDFQRLRCLVLRGRIYSAQGDLDSAIHEFTAVIDQESGFAFPYLWRSEAYKKKGDEAQAEKDLTTAKKLGGKESDMARTNGMFAP